jgi:hypothetical protein
VTDSMRTTVHRYSTNMVNSPAYDAEMEPYLSLFLKPFTRKRSEFSKQELADMCKDPLHSPRLIRYLIEFVKKM